MEKKNKLKKYIFNNGALPRGDYCYKMLDFRRLIERYGSSRTGKDYGRPLLPKIQEL